MVDDILINTIREAQLLGIFKAMCDRHSSSKERKKIQNIMAFSDDKLQTLIMIVRREYNMELNDIEAARLLQLIDAFLKKSNYRKRLNLSEKNELLVKQKNKCAICNCKIEHTCHADHIVPFKYVGDILENNWQILCSRCNVKKNSSIDYQIKHLLKLV